MSVKRWLAVALVLAGLAAIASMQVTASGEDVRSAAGLLSGSESDMRGSIKPPTAHDPIKEHHGAETSRRTKSTETATGAVFQTETVDSAGDVGQFTSLALDIESNPHISYYDATNSTLKYTCYDTSGWSTETVDEGDDDAGQHTSLALDSAGRPRISYRRSAPGLGARRVTYLALASYDGAAWFTETIEIIGEYGGYTSLALDSNDQPHISYYNANDSALKIAAFDGSTWHTETVDGFRDDVGQYTSLALDASDAAHISYIDVTNHQLKYARWYKDDWQIQTPDPTRDVDGGTSLDLDRLGRPHISYHDVRRQALRYAVGDGVGGWATTQVAGPVDAGFHNALSLGIKDHPGIGYRDADSGSLKLAVLKDTFWTSETVDDGGIGGDAGEYVSLAWNAAGNPHLSYYQRSAGDALAADLRYARLDLTPPTIISGPLVISKTCGSAVIAWQTDEPSDGTVLYGSQAETFSHEEADPVMQASHEVLLAGLEPSTVYRFAIRSIDGAGNEVVTDEWYFETLPTPDSEPPTLAGLTFARVEGPLPFYEMAASGSDNAGIEKVEFFFDGRLIGADYGDSSGAEYEYRTYMDPFGMGLGREAFLGEHTIQALAHDTSGLIRDVTIPDFQPPPEPLDGEFQILYPPPDHVVYIDGDQVPQGETLTIQVHAAEHEYDCHHFSETRSPLFHPPAEAPISPLEAANGDGSIFPFDPIPCPEVARPVSQVVFSIDDEVVYTATPSTTDLTYTWDIGGMSDGEQHLLGVWAYATDGGAAYRERIVSVASEGLDVQRAVARNGNLYTISLEVTNEGSVPIELDTIQDNVTSFQAIRRHHAPALTGYYDVTTNYMVGTQQCLVNIDLQRYVQPYDRLTLDPAEHVTLSYLAVPIRQTVHVGGGFHIGENEVQVGYYGHAGFTQEEFDRGFDPQQPPHDIPSALGASNYLIATNPARLFDTYAHDDVNDLLATMAELARWQNGTLGYLFDVGGQLDASSAEDVDDKLGAWGLWMRGSDGVPQGYRSNGHLLIVGESQIVPAWSQTGFGRTFKDGTTVDRVDLSDHPYADTGGSGAPDLSMGRIIGNSAAALRDALKSIVDVYGGSGAHTFDRSHALMVTEWGYSIIESALTSAGFSVDTLDFGNYSESGAQAEFLDNIRNKDAIAYYGHGNVDQWEFFNTNQIGSFDFGATTPFVYAASCLTGNYEGTSGEGGPSVAREFMSGGAGGYVGSTEIAPDIQSRISLRLFFEHWDPGKSVGTALTDLERDLWGDDAWYRFVAWEYNLYGDPTYGAAPGPDLSGVDKAEAPSSLDVLVPDYQVTNREGWDYVEIRDGKLLLVEERPQVPSYAVRVDYPKGQRVQDVILTHRGGLGVDSGLHLPVATFDIASREAQARSVSDAVGGWYPEETYSWELLENPDSTSTLVVTVYPFLYNPQTTAVRFYKNYSFDIEVISSTVDVHLLTTDKEVYEQGDEVDLDLWLKNVGDPQDVFVDVVVSRAFSGKPVDGLILEKLHGLAGLASFSGQWDSSGVEPGQYTIEVELRDGDGNLLDRETKGFQIGIHAGEIMSFTASPTTFDIGDGVDTTMIFQNTGTVPLTGTALVEVQAEPELTTTAAFSHTIANLAPSSSVLLEDTWDTSRAAEGSYRMMGQVSYHSTSTDPASVTVSTFTAVYLPLVLKQD